MSFCGICTADIPSDAPHYMTDGVITCDECENGEIVAFDSERGYVPPNSAGSLRNAKVPAFLLPYKDTLSVNGTKIQPGHLLIRIPRKLGDGSPVDNREAYEAAGRAAPGSHLTFIGQTIKWFVFAIPNPTLDPPKSGLDAIEQWRRR